MAPGKAAASKPNSMYTAILIPIGFLALGVLAVLLLKRIVNHDAAKVSRAASAITDFELPAGYAPEFTASLMGYAVAAFNRGDGHSHLYLIQSTKGSDAAKLFRWLARLAPGSKGSFTDITVTEHRAATIRGQEVTLIVGKGIDREGRSCRQLTATFRGKGGPALLVLSEPTTHWNQYSIDAFIASIR